MGGESARSTRVSPYFVRELWKFDSDACVWLVYAGVLHTVDTWLTSVRTSEHAHRYLVLVGAPHKAVEARRARVQGWPAEFSNESRTGNRCVETKAELAVQVQRTYKLSPSGASELLQKRGFDIRLHNYGDVRYYAPAMFAWEESKCPP